MNQLILALVSCTVVGIAKPVDELLPKRNLTMNSLAINLIDRNAPAASPFLPGTFIQYAWDSTSLGYLKTCARLYQLIMIEGWGEGDENIHIRFGQEYHSSLEDYDRFKALGDSHEDAVRKTLRALLERTYGWEVDEETRAGKYKNRKSLVRTVLWYLDHFEEDPAETIILDNGQPAVELSFRFELISVRRSLLRVDMT